MNKSSPKVAFRAFCDLAPAYLSDFTSSYLPSSTFHSSRMEELKYSAFPLPEMCFPPLNSTYFNSVQMSLLEKDFPGALASSLSPISPNHCQAIALPSYSKHYQNFVYHGSIYYFIPSIMIMYIFIVLDP